jgi:Zn-finger protein
MASAFSGASGVSESKSGLRDDTECSYCGIVLYKHTDFFKESEGIDGEILYECARCYLMNEDEKSHMLELSLKSRNEMKKAEEEFAKDHSSMLAMSDFDSSLNGAVDFEGWMAAVSEVMKPDSAAGGCTTPAKAGCTAATSVATIAPAKAGCTTGCGEVKTLNILPDAMMAEKIKQMQDESIAEMEKAKSEWADKSEHFLSPSEMEFIHGDGVHGPDALSYQDWRSESVRIPVPILKDGVSVDEKLCMLRSKWLSPKPVGAAGGAAGGCGASGGCGATEEPPTVTNTTDSSATGASNEPEMSARQMWLLGLMDN